MALTLNIGKDNIEVISSRDGSLGVNPDDPWLDAEGKEKLDEKGKPTSLYQQYLETLDEAILQLKPDVEPTRFVMRRVLPYSMSQKIKTEQAGTNAEGKVEVRMGFIMDEIRAALVDVKNPGAPALAFKKDSDGCASKELVSTLESMGVTNELFAARQGALKAAGGAPKKS